MLKNILIRAKNIYKKAVEMETSSCKKLQMCGTEAEMREVAGKICRNYLHGAWKKVDPQAMYFRRISGGLSNFLYLIGLPDDVTNMSNLQVDSRESTPEDDPDKNEFKSPSFTMLEEPNKVLLRIYGQIHGERAMDAIVTESVIFTLLSERKLGPRLYGVFSGGRIEEYIPARPLFTKELGDPAISMKIAEKMAAIHSLELPLSKDPDWIWKTAYKWLKTYKAERTKFKPKSPEEERIIAQLAKVDFDKELQWLKKFLSTVDSPVVFCHNDMQEGNILIFEDVVGSNTDTFEGVDDARTSSKEISNFDDANTSDSILSRISDSGEPRMMFIDYEYCAYNHRGFDIANHFQEWGLDYSNKEPPFYYWNEEDLPTLEQKEIFIKEYLKHYHANLSDKGEQNPPTLEQVNQLLSEVDAYSLSSNLLWTLWSCVQSKSQIPFGYWEYARTRLDTYFNLKQEIIKKANKRKICEVDI